MRLGDGGEDEHDDDVGVNGYEDFEDFFIELRFVSMREGLTNGMADEAGGGTGI